MAPERTDIRVQLANMLKDAGALVEAEECYATALLQRPDDADIHLQMGHVLKLRGRRALALASYRRALDIDPNLPAARSELAAAGDPEAQLRVYEDQMREGGVEALMSIRHLLDRMSEQITAIRRSLPGAEGTVAWPVDAYSDLRRLFDCPSPGLATPRVSIEVILPADREPPDVLFAQLNGILNQVHETWSLRVIGRDLEKRAAVERVAVRDPRVRWVDADAEISAARSEWRCMRESEADWTLLVSEGALLHPQALAWVAAVGARTKAQAVYFDEEYGEPNDWSGKLTFYPRQIADADSILEANVCGESIAIAREVIGEMAEWDDAPSISAARRFLVLGLIRKWRVMHVPLPLVRMIELPTRDPAKCLLDQGAAVRAFLSGSSDADVAPANWSPGVLRVLRMPSDRFARIAVIVPTRDNAQDLKAFVESLVTLAYVPEAISIFVLDNGRGEERGDIVDSLARFGNVSVAVVDEPFNWSRFNNIAANRIDDPILVFANDDMLMLTEGWDEVVRSLAERRDVGAMGARLLYPDNTIQHAGILFDWRGSVIHDGLYRAATEAGPGQRWHVSRSVSAVTGAFLVTRRLDFLAVGGFDETHLAISYSDVDYCLKQRAAGRRVLWTPMISLYHHESKTRGFDYLSPAKAARDKQERKVLEERWPDELMMEPSLHPFWQQATLPHRLLAIPSREKIWGYIDRAALADPWCVGISHRQ